MKTELAKLLYETYCAVGGKAFNGDPLPGWDAFAADPKKTLQSDAWQSAAETAIKTMMDIKVESLELGDNTILLIKLPRTQALNSTYCGGLKRILSELFPKGQKIFAMSDDMNVEILGDLLTAEDLANLAARMERKNKSTGPQQRREFGIIVNTREKKFIGDEITYEQVVEFAGKTDFKTNENGVHFYNVRGDREFKTLYTVTWGIRHENGGGELSPCQTVTLRPGMIFNVANTSGA